MHSGNTSIFEKLWEEVESDPEHNDKSYEEKMKIVNRRFESLSDGS